MHIPDGYLSPQTTIPGLAAMVPLWGVSYHKVKRELKQKDIPQIALCSAFSFLAMMFNVPVAGGSSVHAVGSVFVAILLGPWASVISVSTALLIQALMFGDGGILAFGMNCLNMAVVMPFAGYGIYKLLAGKSEFGSGRNLVAAFFGAYCGLNLAAFCAGVEFGIQPLLFQDAAGQPLYCPYPLSVSIPSMMSAHLIVAGPIEGIVTAAALAYVAKFAPNLMHRLPAHETERLSFFKRYKPVLIVLLILVVLTPAGLLATGTAWGEYGTDELKEMIGYIPKGMAQIADKWSALMPDYSLSLLGDGQAASVGGYILSAVIGITVVGLVIFLMSKLFAKKGKEANAHE
jgi:cobalt/nickel transport system permease protein